MWLLNTNTLKLRSFFENIPDYVILSHTWGEGEVAFEDIGQPHASTMLGYGKILGCCRLAMNDGFEWAWIDTCCIDKRSSAELSEAINSMYKWYWDAAICYVYLSDIPTGWEDTLETSRWFTRGWTLQELLAPAVVEFYTAGWKLLGTKAKLIDTIAKATKIEPMFIVGRDFIKKATIGTKFSWAATRKTTREEDMAYCLLGIVEVNMPMLYGEGERAFYRLQLEVMRQTNDQTLFAWESPHPLRQTVALLAPAPTHFADAPSFRRASQSRPLEASTHEITNNGLRITLPVLKIDQNRVIALLDCENRSKDIIGIWLEIRDDGRYQRLQGSRLVGISTEETGDAELVNMYVVVKDDLEGRESRAPHELILGTIMSNDGCQINGITIYRQNRTSMVKNVLHEARVFADPNAFNDQVQYLLHELLLIDGEAVSFRIRNTTRSYYEVVFIALRRNRPVVRCFSDNEGFSMSLFDDLRVNKSGDWDLASDYARYATSSSQQIHVETKKRRVNGRIRYELTLKLVRCFCKLKTDGEACSGRCAEEVTRFDTHSEIKPLAYKLNIRNITAQMSG